MAVREGKLVTTKSITDFSIEELEAEIKRQKEVAVPTMIETPVITKKLIGGCKEYIECITQKRPIHDCEHFIFEAAVEAIFGPSVWAWIRSNI